MSVMVYPPAGPAAIPASEPSVPCQWPPLAGGNPKSLLLRVFLFFSFFFVCFFVCFFFVCFFILMWSLRVSDIEHIINIWAYRIHMPHSLISGHDRMTLFSTLTHAMHTKPTRTEPPVFSTPELTPDISGWPFPHRCDHHDEPPAAQVPMHRAV